MKIAIVGAGSREFGPATVADILLSDPISGPGVHLSLMDVDESALNKTEAFANACARTLDRSPRVTSTTSLDQALEGAAHVILAVERERYFFWSQDFHIPRKLGFQQVYGENGGPGGLFHALRNMTPCVEVARTMERVCPDAWLLNFTNPLAKLCEALTRLTTVKTVGLCHGVFGGMDQVADLLGKPVETIEFEAYGLNHFTWFTKIQERATGQDLYPELAERERRAHWLADWDDMALSRTLFRVYGLYPSPGTNHIGEYIGWARDFLASSHLQFFDDPAGPNPESQGAAPPWIYSLHEEPTKVPLTHPTREGRLRPSERSSTDASRPAPSGELTVPFIEGVSCGVARRLDAVNVPNRGYIAGLREGAVVEVPAQVGEEGLVPTSTRGLPEGPLAMLRPQLSISALLVEAFSSGTRKPLLQALLLDPTTPSYQNAVHLIDEMFRLQEDVLPPLEW